VGHAIQSNPAGIVVGLQDSMGLSKSSGDTTPIVSHAS